MTAVSEARAGIDLLHQREFDTIVLDVMLPDMSGLHAMAEIREIDTKIPVIFITAGGESDTAIEAMKLGAYDYLMKPLDRDQVRALVSQALEIRELMDRRVELHQPSTADGDALVGRCPAMQQVYKSIGRVASQDVTVMIQGESGTGKELVARAIYQHSQRADGPFLAINCAAIPEALLESELFGHEKGAFTGADRRRIGKFEQCHGGTLFLDEIGDMTPSTQSKVLRVLQQQQFERLGGTETIETDVRIIAASHRDLDELVSQGTFRGDLFYRLNVFEICLPPLRERTSDLPLLLQHFLARFRRDLKKEVNSITPEAMDMLLNYGWPGNVREFQSVIKRALIVATGPVLLPEFLQTAMQSSRGDRSADTSAAFDPMLDQFIRQRISDGSENLHADAIERLERRLFTLVLRHTDGNKLQAARILGITRSTLRNKIGLLGIDQQEAERGPSTD